MKNLHFQIEISFQFPLKMSSNPTNSSISITYYPLKSAFHRFPSPHPKFFPTFPLQLDQTTLKPESHAKCTLIDIITYFANIVRKMHAADFTAQPHPNKPNNNKNSPVNLQHHAKIITSLEEQ